MRKITFDEEELFVIAIFDEKSRHKAVEEMGLVLTELAEDPEMHALLVSTMEKLKRISDEEFAKLDLESYRADLTDGDTDDTIDDDYLQDGEEAPAAGNESDDRENLTTEQASGADQTSGSDTSDIPAGGTDK